LIDEFGFAQENLAQRIGKNRSTVANYLRLLSLPKPIQQSLIREEISMGHAKVILSLKDFEKQTLLYETIIRDSLSVSETEKAALRIEQKEKKKKLVHENRDFFLDQLSEKIQQRLGTKVSILGKGKRGRISIDYYNLDDLDRLLAVFGVDTL
jgi:ParB family chromosome partitioning protein